MHEFRRYVILIICIASCAISVLLGVMQMIEDKRDEAGFNEVKWDTPKVPYYRGGSAYRAPSSQGSTVTMPRVSSSSQTLFHHNAGGTSAGQGAGTYRSGYAQTGYRSYASSSAQSVRTFSNGAIHSYGGSGSGGGMTGVSSHRKTANSGGTVGYTSSGISISIPRTRSYANNSVKGTSSSEPVRQSMPGRRNAPVYDEDEDYTTGDVVPDDGTGDTEWWLWDLEEWVPVEGRTTVVDGVLYKYDGLGNLVFVGDLVDPDTPIGDIPWLLLLLMVGGYVVLRKRRMSETE